MDASVVQSSTVIVDDAFFQIQIVHNWMVVFCFHGFTSKKPALPHRACITVPHLGIWGWKGWRTQITYENTLNQSNHGNSTRFRCYCNSIPFRSRPSNGHPHTNHFRHLGVRDVVRDNFGKFWKVPGIPFLAWASWNDHWGRWLEVSQKRSCRFLRIHSSVGPNILGHTISGINTAKLWAVKEHSKEKRERALSKNQPNHVLADSAQKLCSFHHLVVSVGCPSSLCIPRHPNPHSKGVDVP